MEKIIEKSGKTIDEAVKAALDELGTERENVEIEVIKEGKRGLLGFGAEEAVVRVKMNVPETETETVKGEDYIKAIIEKMGIEGQVTSTFEDETLNIEINGDSDCVGRIIGRRGDTLDAIQYLTSLVVNKGEKNYIRVNVDTEKYREKREETLKKLAKRVASTVMKTRKSVTLEPMNPNERRIIHSALQGFHNITTYSTGEEPNRCIVISTKKKEYGSDYVSKYRYNRKENELKTE